VAYVASWSVHRLSIRSTHTHQLCVRAHRRGRTGCVRTAGCRQSLRTQTLKKVNRTENHHLCRVDARPRGSPMPRSRIPSRVRCDSAVELLREYAADGIDLDWSIRARHCRNQISNEDKRNFTLLLQTVRERLDAQSTAASEQQRPLHPDNRRSRRSTSITPKWKAPRPSRLDQPLMSYDLLQQPDTHDRPPCPTPSIRTRSARRRTRMRP